MRLQRQHLTSYRTLWFRSKSSLMVPRLFVPFTFSFSPDYHSWLDPNTSAGAYQYAQWELELGRSDEGHVHRHLVFFCRAEHQLLFARIEPRRFRVLAKNGMDATETSQEQEQQIVRRAAGYAEFQPSASCAEDERGDCQWLRSVLLQRCVAPSRCFMTCTIFKSILTLVRVAHASITSVDSSATPSALQTVVVSDPHVMAQLLHDNSLNKPARPDYIHFRQVSTHHQLCPSPLCICCC